MRTPLIIFCDNLLASCNRKRPVDAEDAVPAASRLIHMKHVCLFLFVLTGPGRLTALQAQQNWRSDLLRYITTKLSKPDGGYGWEDQYDSHTTVCFQVTGTLHAIGALPENKAALADFICTHHPQTGPNREAGPSGTELRNLVYEQIQAMLWLGADASSFKEKVSGWKSQAGLLANYEEHKYPVMYQEAMIPVCQQLTGAALTDAARYIDYFNAHRRPNGSYNNAPAAAGGDGNILNTWWALYAWNALEQPPAAPAETRAWLQSCQLPGGGFTHQPHPLIGVNDDVIYTWAGIKALHLLDAQPQDKQAAIRYLLSLHNPDGGFGSRPGLHSTPAATYYATDALKTLNALAALDKAPPPAPLREPHPDFTGYKVYSVQFEGSGAGSPAEAVMLAKELHLHLWGVKNAQPDWIRTAQALADKERVPVRFFVSDEPYNGSVAVPGMGSFEHILDYIVPGHESIRFKDSTSFAEFKATTLQAVKAAGGGLLLQVANNEPTARLLLDEAINAGLGYIGISTVHFGQNFAFWLPYIMDYRYRMPLVTLQDAHGVEPWWWAGELTNHRTLFIAKEPTYDALITAFKNNWIAAVRHDSLSKNTTRLLGGTEAARQFINAQEAGWKWWTAPGKPVRPQVAITVIGSADLFDAGRPAGGVAVRVRTQWDALRESLKAPLTALQELKVDGQAVATEAVVKNGKKEGTVTDAYYLFNWNNPPAGTHLIEATVKDLKTGAAQTYKQTYIQP